MRLAYSERIKIALLSLVLFLMSIVLLHYTSKDKTLINYSYQLISEIIFPFQNFNKSTQNFVKDTYNNYINLVNLKFENEELKLKISKLEQKNLQIHEQLYENKNLRRLLRMKRRVKMNSIGAEVIGYDPSKWGRSVIINRGSDDKIKIGNPVLNDEGIVGQITALSQNTAKVLLIIDRTSAVDVILQKTRARGILEGGGQELCYLKYVVKNFDIKIGDKILTSGLDNVFPKGFLIGYVSDFHSSTSGLFDVIKATPAVDFTKLEHVIILKK